MEFLNGVDPTGSNALELFDSRMSSHTLGGIVLSDSPANGSVYETKPGRDNNPVDFVTWYDAVRFANWLHNGKGSGDTETGAYTLLGGAPTPSNGPSITRNAGAKWSLPTLDEWYKSAYHKNDGDTSNYWEFPTSTNAEPFSAPPPGSDAPDPTNTANYSTDDGVANGYNDGYAVTGSSSFDSSINYLTNVGAYNLALSPYGTYDQGGNVWEWNETLIPYGLRSIRGGAYLSYVGNSDQMRAAFPEFEIPTMGYSDLGFRVVALIPEPCGLALSVVCLISILPWRLGR